MKKSCSKCASVVEVDGQMHCSDVNSPRFQREFQSPGPGCLSWTPVKLETIEEPSIIAGDLS